MIPGNRNIPKSEHNNFKKWLRYYFDFCKKYNHLESKDESLSSFIKKLQKKCQSTDQQKQASYAITLYYSLLRSDCKNSLPDFDERLPDKDKPSIGLLGTINLQMKLTEKAQCGKSALLRLTRRELETAFHGDVPVLDHTAKGKLEIWLLDVHHYVSSLLYLMFLIAV